MADRRFRSEIPDMQLQAAGAVADAFGRGDKETLKQIAAGELPKGWNPQFAAHLGTMAIAAKEALDKGDRNTKMEDGIGVRLEDSRIAAQQEEYASRGGGDGTTVMDDVLTAWDASAAGATENAATDDGLSSFAAKWEAAKVKAAGASDDRGPVHVPSTLGTEPMALPERPAEMPSTEATQIIAYPTHAEPAGERIGRHAAPDPDETRVIRASTIASSLMRPSPDYRAAAGERTVIFPRDRVGLQADNHGIGETTAKLPAPARPAPRPSGEDLRTRRITPPGHNTQAVGPAPKPVRFSADLPEDINAPDTETTLVLQDGLHALNRTSQVSTPPETPVKPVNGSLDVTQPIHLPPQMPRDLN